MKTEREQLEENTRKEKALQVREELAQLIVKLYNDMYEADAVYMRSMGLEVGAAFAWIFTGVLTPEGSWLFLLAWFLWLFTLIRGHNYNVTAREAAGKIDGALDTLMILGYIDPPDLTKRKKKLKRKSRFKRFKEFWQRMGESKEAYA